MDHYSGTVEIFGRTFGYHATPLQMSGLDGWAVRSEHGVLEAWFLSPEHARQWIDQRIDNLS